MSEERDSQLSAMFDGELPEAECELLARRLSRDPALQAQWSRYALIGAALRGEPVQSALLGRGGRVETLGVARRVRRELSAGRAEQGPAAGAARRRWRAFAARWGQPIAGAAIAAAVAGLAVVWLQSRVGAPAGQSDRPPPTANNAGSDIVVVGPAMPVASVASAPEEREPVELRRAPAGAEPQRYTVPAADGGMPARYRGTAELANYVVAHSAYAAPLNRRNVLSALMVGDAPVETAGAAAPGNAP
ncbi:MAG: sigma-E factor negative regulatory protein [Steroidobacteraceae bacterium]|nr:sigma-E factor negative regulatory protein [Steroidobacteraceae bacterium]MDW8259082.1 sigma-E factor negative regulatory protein [Gammaproteobacteria bacterium]